LTYVDAFHDRKNDRIHIAERINGQRNLRSLPANYVFYYDDPNGSYRSIFGHHCAKFITRQHRNFRAMLDCRRTEGRAIFESDINPVFRCLADNYMGAPAPILNVGFFDIEANFHPVRGYAPSTDPFNEITAITLYRTGDEKLLTFVLCPETVDTTRSQQIAGKFTNTMIFDDEKEMLEAFLAAIQDVDVLTGWNCLPKTQSVWLTDRIVSLGDVKVGSETAAHGGVVAYRGSGKKKVNRIILDNGQIIEASDEHVIPVYTKPQDSYNRPSTLIDSLQELRVDEIKQRHAEGQEDLYLEIKLRKNTNKDYTYREFLIENFDAWMSMEDFDIAITTVENREKICAAYQADGSLHKNFKHGRYISSFREYPRMWRSKNHPMVSRQDLIDQLQNISQATCVVTGNQTFTIDLDRPIAPEIFEVLGMQYTGGTYYRKAKSFILYNTDIALLDYYRSIIIQQYKLVANTKAAIATSNDGRSALDYRCGSVFGFLAPMIYDPAWNKRLHVEMLSRCSERQMMGFVAGLINGNGCVSENTLSICNFDGDVQRMQELLQWNGIDATATDDHVRIVLNEQNEHFVRNLDIRQSKRKLLIENMKFNKMGNAPDKMLRKFIIGDHAIVRIRKIIATDTEVDMADIQTEKSYFHAKGVRVHNSSDYDIPYTINRVARILSQEATKRFCLWKQKPHMREYVNKFGKPVITYDLVGRVHLDYMELYAKHNTQQRLSYALNAIGEIEVGEFKTPYSGTLDDLYKKDLKLFIEYNRQDVMLMVKIDQKNKFIDLANQIAHANCVLLKTTMGSVALVEQAIINEMHAMGRIVPDRPERDNPNKQHVDIDLEDYYDDDDDDEDGEADGDARTPVVGAYVAKPKTGVHKHIGASDINSLYPSAIRALNMSPETLVGQVRLDETMKLIQARAAALPRARRAEAWDGIFAALEVTHMHNRDDTVLTVDFFDHLTDTTTTKTWTGADLYDYVFDDANHVCITANGTIFRTDVDGMIPTLLATWYADRKVMQATAKTYAAMAAGVAVDADLEALLNA
jgi:DNA polymerase elongation subunit (family B)